MAGKNLSNTAYDELLRRIITCKYAPGSLLSEESLVEELGCSRTPIRSALVRLEAEHLVQTISKRGILIKPITLSEIRDVYNLRELLETYAIEKFGGQFEKERLMEYFFLFKAPIPEEDFFYHDTRFHQEIIDLTQNSFIAQQFVSLQNIMQRMALVSGSTNRKRLEESHQEHMRIVTALLQDNYLEAAEAMRVHLNNGRISVYQAVMNGSSDILTKSELS